MEYIIASFRSRSQVYSFADTMKKSGLYYEIVTTPKEVSLGCGLAVKMNKNNISDARSIINNYYYENFSGFYVVTEKGLRREVKSIY